MMDRHMKDTLVFMASSLLVLLTMDVALFFLIPQYGCNGGGMDGGCRLP